MTNLPGPHNSLQLHVIDWIVERLDDEDRRQFLGELRDVMASAPPDTIRPDGLDPEAETRTIRVAEQFVDVLRSWHLSVHLSLDEEAKEQIAEAEAKWTGAVNLDELVHASDIAVGVAG